MRIVLFVVALAAALNTAGWYLTGDRVEPAEVKGAIDYLSYSPYVGNHDPKDQRPVSVEQLTRDMQVIAKVANGVRTYSLVDGVDQVPAIAEKQGLTVSLGAWVGDTPERDRFEIDTAVALAKQHRNIKSVLVGNEVLLRGERSVDELIASIKEVKRQVRVPVSTGEIWYNWIKYPQLVKNVDFIAAHILPYWEGVPADKVVEYTWMRLEQLKKAYPGKRIVIAEFGWPSQGYNRNAAEPTPLAQAEVIRNFLAEAERRGIEYNIVEAFDQTWKTNEGSVGAYWGIFDADRQLKFPLSGIVEKPGLDWTWGLALVIGALLTVAGLSGRRPTVAHALLFALAANAMACGLAVAFAYPFENYMMVSTSLMWGTGFVLVCLLTVITLTKVHEIAEVSLGRRPRRLFDHAQRPMVCARAPKVSIHIPAYREPPAMLIETLNSMAALDYPDFEVLVIINNTPEPGYSQPVAQRCAELGPRFKFLDITCSGFKAGALNVALTEHTAADAEIIAVVDADYVVERNWLSDLVPLFADPKMALVQAPQDHRDGHESPLKAMMDAEYAGFFDIGMVQRNEDNAIIAHGTMLLVRRSALEAVGSWSTDTICEDTELGLRLFEAGYAAQYTTRRYGRGLLPDTFQAFKTQRFRWAYGAMQIIRKHWPHMLPRAGSLSPRQKRHFLSGWSLWLADAVGAVVAIMNLFWVPVVLFVGVVLPMVAFTVPIITAFVVNLLHCAVLYGKRVNLPAWRIPGAAIAAMSLQLTVARAVLTGVVKDSLPFKRTEKGGAVKSAPSHPAKWETIVGLLLAAAAVTLHLLNYEQITEWRLLAVTLAIQSVPFLAATLMVTMERFPRRLLWGRRPSQVATVNLAAPAELR
ncbi:MAG: glycosyltransferase [Rhodospirillales bacterium]|jgi:exo-beta-1,3-glucanase (GH17 family)/cellulose synthase/poly-beta-1,6-N-acetylglucosamine synthase-like glycosyltransferase|nr:glycosyltransferase [Rhodospirillales bacterium]